MYKASSRYQPHALPRTETQVEPIAAPIVSPRRRLRLRSVLNAFAFVAEARTLPFAGAISARDEHTPRDY
jgi:hypothetical protein